MQEDAPDGAVDLLLGPVGVLRPERRELLGRDLAIVRHQRRIHRARRARHWWATFLAAAALGVLVSDPYSTVTLLARFRG